MSTPVAIVIVLAAAAVAALLWFRLPRLVGGTHGRVLLLLSMCVMPLLLVPVGVTKSLTSMKQTNFCTSCHEMEVYGVSLQIDDPEYLPAVHFQNHLVPPDTACYACHTDYTLYGDVEAKLAGMKHMWIHYFGDVPEPGGIKLYKPYPNDNCLKCHAGSRRFEKKASHTTKGVTLEQLYANQKSCVSQGCHDKIHDIKGLGGHDLFGEPRFAIPEALKKAAAGADDPFAEPAGGGAKDPFDEPAGGGAKDPFADEPKAPAGDRPATEIKNVDELFDEPAKDASGDGGDVKPSDATPSGTPAPTAPTPSDAGETR